MAHDESLLKKSCVPVHVLLQVCAVLLSVRSGCLEARKVVNMVFEEKVRLEVMHQPSLSREHHTCETHTAAQL